MIIEIIIKYQEESYPDYSDEKVDARWYDKEDRVLVDVEEENVAFNVAVKALTEQGEKCGKRRRFFAAGQKKILKFPLIIEME